jgi:catecholate siderophore receptor
MVASVAMATPAQASTRRAGDDEWAAARPYLEGQSSAARTQRFDIPEGPLDRALQTLARVSKVDVTAPADVTARVTTAGISGTMTMEQAFTRLLAGTGLTARFTSERTVVVELRAQTENVEVTGAADQLLSSPKYTAALRDIPQTIEVIPRALMDQQGARTLSETLRNVPGISLQAGEGGGASNTAGDMFNMRGFSANNSIFVDGVRDDGLMSRDVFNLEQVEVFLGPAGTDVGRGTAAGYVNMATKTPHAGSSDSTSFAYGAADGKRLTVDANHGLSPHVTGDWRDRVALRLNALWEAGGVVGRDVVTRTSQAIAPSLALGLGTPTRTVVGAQISRQDNVPDYGIPAAAWSGAPLAPATVPASEPVAPTNFYGSVGYDYDRVEQESYTARVEHDLRPSVSVRNQTRYNRTRRSAVISTIQSPSSFVPATEKVTVGRQGNERENEILSNQTSLAAHATTGAVRHAFSAGVEFTADQQFAPGLSGIGTRAPVDIYYPDAYDPIAGYDPTPSGASTRGRTTTAALYGFDSADFGSRWQLSGGVRWEHFSTTFRQVDTAGATATDEDAADNLLSGKAAVLFRLRSDANVYVSYGSSLAPPGTANFALSAQENNQNHPNVKPQESTNLEVGAKVSLLQERLALTAAAFRTRNRNVIFTVDASAVPPLFNQDDGQRVDGVTVGATGRLTDRWNVTASVGYLDTAQETQNPANDGKWLTLTPPLSGSVWTSFRGPRGLTLGGGLRYVDAVFVNSANTIRAPGYRLVDALVEYALNSHLTLRLNLSNVTNEVYIRNVNNNGARYNPGTPRAAVLTSTVSF